MNFIHFIDKLNLNSVINNGIIVNDCYRGKGILIYPYKTIKFRTHDFEKELINKERENNLLSIYEKWEIVGALKLRQDSKDVIGIKIKLPNSYWPIKVFINIHNHIIAKFTELLDKAKLDGIEYLSNSTLSETRNKIQSSKYILEGVFLVKSNADLLELINLFERAGGGIWGAHSFDCMIEANIQPELIIESHEYVK